MKSEEMMIVGLGFRFQQFGRVSDILRAMAGSCSVMKEKICDFQRYFAINISWNHLNLWQGTSKGNIVEISVKCEIFTFVRGTYSMTNIYSRLK